MSFYNLDDLTINISMIASMDLVLRDLNSGVCSPHEDSYYPDEVENLCRIILTNGEVLFTRTSHFYSLRKFMFPKS